MLMQNESTYNLLSKYSISFNNFTLGASRHSDSDSGSEIGIKRKRIISSGSEDEGDGEF